MMNGVSLVVVSVPSLVVLLDGFSPVSGILATDDHHEAANNGGGSEAQVNSDAEMVSSSLHSISPINIFFSF